MDLRRAAIDRWHREQEDRTERAYLAAQDEYFHLYAVARNVHIRLRLLSDDMELIDHGHRAVKIASDIHHAKSEENHREVIDRAQEALDMFVTIAASRLR